MIDQVLFWDGSSDDGASIMLVPANLKKDFLEYLKEDCLSVTPVHVYVIADTALAEEDINFLLSLIANKYSCDTDARSDLLDMILSLGQLKDFSMRRLLISKYEVKNNIFLSFILRSFKALLSKFEDLERLFLYQFPYLYSHNWVSSRLSIIEHNNHILKKSTDGTSSIEKIYDNTICDVEALLEKYNKFRNYEKLMFFSAYFFSIAQDLMEKSDPTQAIVFLHRALETLFISWLVEDRLITIGAEGKVVGDKYQYLKDYMNMLSGERSISDVEKCNISELNALRNECKYAHGYAYIEASDLQKVFDNLKGLFLNDDEFKKSHLIFHELVKYPDDLISVLYKCITDMHYLEKLQKV